MVNPTLTIRQADNRDIGALADLMNQLGYKTTTANMAQRMDTIFQHPDYKTFVACYEGVVAGMAGACRNYYYEHNGSYVRITALVTHADCRKMGVGKALLEAVESWAKQVGATSLLLNCGNREERKQAHEFYRNRGFVAKSTGYAKSLR
jgi:GNAT superfamily N-acetyltransferase